MNRLKISEKRVQELALRIKYRDEVLKTKKGHPITVITAEQGMSAVRLNNDALQSETQKSNLVYDFR